MPGADTADATPHAVPAAAIIPALNLAVPQAKIPLFVIAVMPIIAVLCAVTAIMGITIYSPTGYASHKNREQKAPGNLAAKGMPAWLDRVQGAQHNTWEATMCLLCAVFVAMSSDFPKGFDKVGFLAKLTTCFLLCRVAYPVAYALDIDLLRTLLWFTGLYTTLMLSFGALFPDSILPMFG
jgi:uncharacterized MAPEG superfamily protein